MSSRLRQMAQSRTRRVAGVAVACGAAAIVMTSLASAAPTTGVTVFLSSRSANDMTGAQCAAQGGCGPTISAPMVLQAGTTYEIHVQGTVSAWADWAKNRTCGKREKAPEYPNSGVTSPAGDDAQFRFAAPELKGQCTVKYPVKTDLFQINLGNGWFHPTADGNPSKPSGNQHKVQHPYTFTVVGLGQQPQFRYVDYHPSDNDGHFSIEIVPGS